MNVREIMTSEVVTVRPRTRIGELVRLVLDRGLSGLPVIGDDGSVIGVVTERDLVTKHARIHVPTYVGILGGVIPFGTRHMDQEARRVLAVTAEELMTREPVTVAPDADVDDAATLMVEEGADPILVVADDRLAGIVTARDILRLLLVEEESNGPSSET